MEEGGIEEQSVPLGKFKLDHLIVEYLYEFGVTVCDVPVVEVLGEWEELGRARVDGHIGMCDGTLESQELRGDLGDDRESGSGVFSLEAEVWKQSATETG